MRAAQLACRPLSRLPRSQPLLAWRRLLATSHPSSPPLPPPGTYPAPPPWQPSPYPRPPPSTSPQPYSPPPPPLPYPSYPSSPYSPHPSYPPPPIPVTQPPPYLVRPPTPPTRPPTPPPPPSSNPSDSSNDDGDGDNRNRSSSWRRLLHFGHRYYYGGLFGLWLGLVIVDDVISFNLDTPKLPISPGDGLQHQPNLDWLFSTTTDTDSFDAEWTEWLGISSMWPTPAAGGVRYEGKGSLLLAAFWQRLRQSPFDDPLMPFPSPQSTRLGLTPELRDGGSQPSALPAAVRAIPPGPSLGFHLYALSSLVGPALLCMTYAHPRSALASGSVALLSLTMHACFMVSARGEYGAGRISSSTLHTGQQLSTVALLFCSVLPTPFLTRVMMLTVQFSCTAGFFISTVGHHLRDQLMPYCMDFLTADRDMPVLRVTFRLWQDSLRRELQHWKATWALHMEAFNTLTFQYRPLYQPNGQKPEVEPAVRVGEEQSLVVALYKVSRRSRQLGQERCAALLQSCLDQPALRQALEQRLQGDEVEVDESACMIKGQEGMATMEAYHHGAVLEPRNTRVVRALPGGVDVYAYFPIRCAASGRTAILCVEGSTQQRQQ